jgi:alpha-ketoglutarate-dependent taurine dioxygenase
MALRVRAVSGRIGAEIEGVDLVGDLDEEAVAGIRAALLRHRVVFFRGQRLDDTSQKDFARRFGQITLAHPTIPASADDPHILPFDSESGSRANQWHTDTTYVDRPPMASVLRAVVLPEKGGDTVWADTVAAYQTLPEPLKAMADRLRAVHSNVHDYDAEPADVDEAAAREYAKVFAKESFEALHPVVRVHPETGERALLLGAFAKRLAGLSGRESADLIRLLQARVAQLENTVRWRWQPGDVAFWDNRATQHYALDDYGGHRRVMHRVTIAGDRPVGTDGTPSRTLSGDAARYQPAEEVA